MKPENRANLTTSEAADYLRYSPRQLMRWRAQGVGPPYVRLGHKVVYPLYRLDQWIAEKVVEPVREQSF